MKKKVEDQVKKGQGAGKKPVGGEKSPWGDAKGEVKKRTRDRDRKMN